MTDLEPTVTHIDHFQRRVLADAVNDATSTYWYRRAETFDAARPRPTDYTGKATEQQIAELDRRCAQAAQACRARAYTSILPFGEVA